MTTIEKIAETISQRLYGKSTRLNAPENQNPDFRFGYAVGMTATKETKDMEWMNGWREYKYPTSETTEWANWKRGFHTGRFHAFGAEAPTAEPSEII